MIGRAKRRPRHGSTLVEILVALPIAMLAAVSAAMLIVQLARSARAQSALLTGSRELRHARLVLAGDLEPLAGNDLFVVSDTLLEFRGQLGALQLCTVLSATSLEVMAPERSSDSWVAALRAGDQLRLWRYGDQPAATPEASSRTIAALPVSLGSGECGPDRTVRRKWRLTFADSLLRVMSGTTVSVHRDVRYRLYRSGAEWWLGRQSRDGAVWEVLQPVAGPLLPPASRGLHLQARSAAGARLNIAAGTSDTIRERVSHLFISMRMARRTRERWSAATDSIELLAPLQAKSYRPWP